MGGRVRVSALVLWIANIGIGLRLLYLWISRGGIRQLATKVTRFPVIMILLHPLAGVTGLGLWLAYLLTGWVTFAWSAFGLICGSALLGFALLTRGVSSRGGRHARGAERHIPGLAVAAHGIVGVTIFVLVLITATIASRG